MPLPADRVRPATCLQRRQVLAGLGARTVANVHFGWRFRGQLNRARLHQALGLLVVRHEALRTALWLNGDAVEQRIRGDAGVSLAPVPQAQDRQAVRQVLRHSATQPFDVTVAPLARVALLRLSALDHMLVWTLHHAISDGWSVHVLLDDFRRAYSAAVFGGEPDWAPLPTLAGDDTASEPDQLDAGARAYWRARLSDRPPELMLRRSMPRVSDAGHLEHLEALRPVSPAVVRALSAGSRDVAATLSMTLTAAFAALMAPYAVDGCVAAGVTEANRNTAESKHLVGCCLDFIPLRVPVSAETTFASVVTQVRDQVRSGRVHRLPIWRIGHEDRSRSPTWFDILVNFTRADPSARAFGESARASNVQHAFGPSPHRYAARFNWSGWRLLGPILHQDAGGGLTGTLLYNRRLMSAELARQLAGRFDRILRAVAAHPDRRLSSLAQLG